MFQNYVTGKMLRKPVIVTLYEDDMVMIKIISAKFPDLYKEYLINIYIYIYIYITNQLKHYI